MRWWLVWIPAFVAIVAVLEGIDRVTGSKFLGSVLVLLGVASALAYFIWVDR